MSAHYSFVGICMLSLYLFNSSLSHTLCLTVLLLLIKMALITEPHTYTDTRRSISLIILSLRCWLITNTNYLIVWERKQRWVLQVLHIYEVLTVCLSPIKWPLFTALEIILIKFMSCYETLLKPVNTSFEPWERNHTITNMVRYEWRLFYV